MTPSAWIPSPERLAEIEAVKQVLLSAERLRAAGVTPYHGRRWYPTFDSWERADGRGRSAYPGEGC